MKTQRFVAKDMPSALAMIQSVLGSNAMIIENRKVADGVEIIAAIDEQLMENNPEVSTNPVYNVLLNRLLKSGMVEAVARQVLNRVNLQQPLQEAWQQTQQIFLNNIITVDQELWQQTGVIGLIGTTGVGKTTTIAKLATQFVTHYQPDQLGLITTDVQRVAAKDQAWLYGHLLGAAVAIATDRASLRQALLDFSNKQLVLVDTAGYSQRNGASITSQLNLLQSECPQLQCYLTLSATTSAEVLAEIIRAYNMPNLKGCIISKCDESANLMPLISLCVQHGLPIAYLGTGQSIPKDLQRANPEQLTELLFDSELLTENV